jgi:hypothetical protein
METRSHRSRAAIADHLHSGLESKHRPYEHKPCSQTGSPPPFRSGGPDLGLVSKRSSMETETLLLEIIFESGTV